MLTIRRVQLAAVAATVLVAGGGYYWAATYTPPGRGGTGWATVVIVLLTMAGVALCGAAIALLSLIRYIGLESKALLDHLEAGVAGLALLSTPLVMYGLPRLLGVVAVSVAILCVVVIARAGYTRFTTGGG